MIARLALAGLTLAATLGTAALGAASATEMRGTAAPETPEAAAAAPAEPAKVGKRSEARRRAPAKPTTEVEVAVTAPAEADAKPEDRPAVRERAARRASKSNGKIEAEAASVPAENAGAGVTAADAPAGGEPAASAEAAAAVEPKGRRAKRAMKARLAREAAAKGAEATAESAPAETAAVGGSGRDGLDALIAAHAKANGLRESFVHRVIRIESRHNPKAIGRGGVYGLMQIKTPTARALGYSGGPSGLLDADTNLTYGVRYLAGAYKVAGGDEARAYSYYQRGYYYAAKAKGLHKEQLRQEQPRPVEVASAEAPAEPAETGRPNASVHDPAR